MGWGTTSWCQGSNSWGVTGWGRVHSNEDPNGQHLNICVSGNKWGKTGLFETHYDEHCPGCRWSRSLSNWGGHGGGDNAALNVVSLFMGGSKMNKLAKKSLFD